MIYSQRQDRFQPKLGLAIFGCYMDMDPILSVSAQHPWFGAIDQDGAANLL